MTLLSILRRRAGGLLLTLAILAAVGVYGAMGLPSAIFPSVTFPTIRTIVDVGEEPAARMMPTVTRPLEEAMLRVPGVKQVRTITSRGSSELTADFAWGTDMQVAMERVQSEAQRVRPDLPRDARIDVQWMNTSSFPIQGYALTSGTLSQAELWDLAEYTLKPELVRIPGVSQVQIQGGKRREFQVQLDRRQLEGRGLSASDVVSAIQKGNQVQSAGLTEDNHELYLALVNGRVHSVEELGRLALPVAGGGLPATLAELGTLQTGDAPSFIRTTANGKPAVLINLIRQPAGSTVEIAAAVRQLFRDRPELLPKKVEWTTFYDQAQFVSDSVRGVRDAILIGVALGAVVLFAFLRNWKLTLVVMVELPLVVALVLLGLVVLGQTINMMTLAGIAAAIGLVADDCIVVIENIARHHERQVSEDPVQSGSRELMPALLGSSLSTIVILLPFSLLTGVVGAFFKPLALTLGLALVASYVVAAVAVPVAVLLFKQPFGSPAKPYDEKRGGLNDRVLGFFLRHGLAGVAAVLGLTLMAGLVLRNLGSDFLPAMDEGSVILDYWSPPGTSLTDTDRMLVEAEKVIVALPDVESYSRRTGTQLGFFITEPNRGDYVIKLKPLSQRRSMDDVTGELRMKLAQLEPALHTDFGQLIEDNIGDLTGGTPQPVDIKIFGNRQGALEAKAREAAAIISKVQGVEDVFDGVVIAGPALNFNIKPSAAARYGLTADDIHAEVEPAITGTTVGQVQNGERMYDLRVFAKPAEGLSQLKIHTPSGSLLPITTVATLSTGAPEAEIDRENLKTYVGVTARLSGRDLGSAMTEIRARLAAQLHLTPDMSLEFGGIYAQQQSSFQSLFYVLLGSLVLVFAVVLFEFGDLRASLVTVVAATATLGGVLGALQLTGMTLNVSSFVGAIMMVGIVGENVIFVIHEAQLGLRSGLAPREAWFEASRRRTRPVLMTVLATGFALMPLAVALGTGSQLMQPLAVAVIGGFTLSAPIVLWVVPGLYHALDPRGRLGRA